MMFFVLLLYKVHESFTMLKCDIWGNLDLCSWTNVTNLT